MAKLRHGEGSVAAYTLANGSTRYRARWWDSGRLRSQSFATREEAESHLIDLSGNRRTGRHVPVSAMTVRQAMDAYLARNADRWSTNTQASYRQVANSHIYPHIGNVRIATITTSRVQAWVDTLKAKTFRKKQLSPSTINNAHLLVRGMFADLVRMDEIQRNPAIGVRLPPRKRTAKTVWDESQIAAVIRRAAESEPMVAVFYRVALTTGMRPGEVRALMWKDIDFEAGTITCERSITRDERFRQKVGTTTKTSRTRTIAVPASTIQALRDHRKAQVERRLAATDWIDTGLVLVRANGQMMPQQTIFRAHKRICAATGVPYIRLHDLRHTAATAMLKRGVPVKVVSDILGHATIATTLDIYAHMDVAMQREATDILGEIAK